VSNLAWIITAFAFNVGVWIGCLIAGVFMWHDR